MGGRQNRFVMHTWSSSIIEVTSSGIHNFDKFLFSRLSALSIIISETFLITFKLDFLHDTLACEDYGQLCEP